MSVKRLCYHQDEAMDIDNDNSEESQPASQVSINSLNYDCLALIFSYLPVTQIREMKKVCYRWKEASQFTWPEIKTFDCNNYTRTLLSQRSVFSRTMYHVGRFLTNLTISDIYNSKILPIVYKFCVNLTKLTIDCSDYCREDFQDIEKLDKLKSINIHGINAWKADSHDDYVGIYAEEYLKNLPEGITELILTTKDPECHTITNYEIFFDLELEKFPGLRQLKLQNCKIMNVIIRELLLKESLVHLELEHCSFEKDDSQDPFVPYLPNLEYLNIRLTDDITNEDCLYILNACRRNLKHLNLSQTWFQLSTYKELSNLENLTYLNLSNVKNIDDDIISSIAHNCVKLTDLNIDYRGCIFHNTRGTLTEKGLRDIACLENLEVFSAQNNKNIDDSVIYKITENCKKIKELILDDCSGISVIALAELSNLNHLESLSLRNLDEVDDIAILNITKNCPKIKKLVLDNCTGITAESLCELSNFRDLELLSLEGQFNIDNNTIFKITENCKQLKNLEIVLPGSVLSLALCEIRKLKNLEVLAVKKDRIDEIFVYDIAKNCNKLKGLRLDNCDDRHYLSSSVLLLLVKSCPDLQYLSIPKVEISVETLIDVIREIKKRKNNTVLTMNVSCSVMAAFEKSGRKSSSLKLFHVQ